MNVSKFMYLDHSGNPWQIEIIHLISNKNVVSLFQISGGKKGPQRAKTEKTCVKTYDFTLL